ncbi:hypothetical protein [Rhodanobacter sp. OK091]|uniref:hypothetical protein n=1 Tax=Rhodanobacter sp. OK091 TaxID=1881037 RepID=UPI0011603529|nr:hypothetical protein [Rhodanobacter sp. OK091]
MRHASRVRIAFNAWSFDALLSHGFELNGLTFIAPWRLFISHEKIKIANNTWILVALNFYPASTCAASVLFMAGLVKGHAKFDQAIPVGGMDFHRQQNSQFGIHRRSPAHLVGADPLLSLRHLQRLP